MKTLIHAAFFMLGAQGATASVMLAPGTVLPGEQYISHGAQFADSVVAIRRVSPSTGAVSYATGIKLTPYHVLTAAHVIDSLSGFRPPQNLTILGGANFLTPTFVISVASYVTHPSYVEKSGLGDGSELDLAIIRTSIAMPGRYLQPSTESPSNGTLITFAGYGMPGLSAAEAQTQDGSLRGFQGISINPLSTFDNRLYGAASGLPTNLLLPGFGSAGDSGAPGFSGQNLVFMASSVNSTGSTYCVDLTTNDARQFIYSNLSRNVIPRIVHAQLQPSTATRPAKFSGTIVDGPFYGSAVLQVSVDLGVSDPWSPLATSTLDGSGAATFAEIPDTRPHALRSPSTFFRILTVPPAP